MATAELKLSMSSSSQHDRTVRPVQVFVLLMSLLFLIFVEERISIPRPFNLVSLSVCTKLPIFHSVIRLMVCISSAKILHVPSPFFMGPTSFVHTLLADGLFGHVALQSAVSLFEKKATTKLGFILFTLAF